ncbi:MAG: RAMP superfamily CRISPR-associated protein [Acidobacteriota bacterium]
MHRALLNHAKLSIVLRPRGPLLIKSGIESSDPTRPSMEFVRTRHAELGETIYIPGTSLKGTFRAYAERMLRSFGVKICDLFEATERCPKGAAKESESTAETFARHCAACRTFGSLRLAGRLNISDAYPWDPGADRDGRQAAHELANKTESRNQVAIDRETGKPVDGSLYDLEVTTAGEFHAQVDLGNFELWQLGLLAATLEELDRGTVAVGFGKSRGLGRVHAEATSLQVTTSDRTTGKLVGVAELCGPEERAAYELRGGEDVLKLPAAEDGFLERISWRGRSIVAAGRPLETILSHLARGPLMTLLQAASAEQARNGMEADHA